MGLTLREVGINTTNAEWQKDYFDRTNPANSDKTVYKLLNISKFGVYWRAEETDFFSSIEDYNAMESLYLTGQD
jgi:hypothetical protein